jgi:hypothetical protein
MGPASRPKKKIRSKAGSDLWQKASIPMKFHRTDIEKWLQNWENIRGEWVKAGITDDIGASAHFLHAIAILSPVLYEIWSLEAETENVKFKGLLLRHKAHWAIAYGRSSTTKVSKAASSTWQGHEGAHQDQGRNRKKSQKAATAPSDKPIPEKAMSVRLEILPCSLKMLDRF